MSECEQCKQCARDLEAGRVFRHFFWCVSMGIALLLVGCTVQWRYEYEHTQEMAKLGYVQVPKLRAGTTMIDLYWEKVGEPIDTTQPETAE